MKYGHFWKTNEIEQIENAMAELLELIAKYHDEDKRTEVDYFRIEYSKLADKHRKVMEDWLAIW